VKSLLFRAKTQRAQRVFDRYLLCVLCAFARDIRIRKLTSEDVHNADLVEGFQNIAPLASEYNVQLALEYTLNAASDE
jgi:hypothetical protein